MSSGKSPNGCGARFEGKKMPISFANVAYLLAVCAGLSFVFQQAVNANLRAEIGSPWWAGFVSYLGGTIVMLVVAVLMREPWPSVQAIQRSHLMSWTGGVFGAIYIAISILLIPRLGAATVIALIVAGQMIGALAFDHFGILGVPVHSVNASRLLGAVLLVAGVVLIRL
jgi:bacterial/archaeal transporter family-2 protein